jgi:hypothetical protein
VNLTVDSRRSPNIYQGDAEPTVLAESALTTHFSRGEGVPYRALAEEERRRDLAVREAGAAAGTFLGRTTFLAAGVAGLGGLIVPMRTTLPGPRSPGPPLRPFRSSYSALNGTLSRLDGGLLVVWLFVALRAGPPAR